MRASGEWRKMEEVWGRAFAGRDAEVRASTQRVNGRWYAFLSARRGRRWATLVQSWPRLHEEDAYADLLVEYLKDWRASWPASFARAFPPCSSAEELELKLAVSGGAR